MGELTLAVYEPMLGHPLEHGGGLIGVAVTCKEEMSNTLQPVMRQPVDDVWGLVFKDGGNTNHEKRC